MRINASKKFDDSYTQTRIRKRPPKNTREAFYIAEVNESGIFKIEDVEKDATYDRCYVFSDINYVNLDEEKKDNLLLSLARFLNSMNTDFKITVAKEYKDMNDFINKVFTGMVNKDTYDEIFEGMIEFVKEKRKDASIPNTEKVLYLTITKKANSYEEARRYFYALDTSLINLFTAMKSSIVAIKGKERLNTINRFFYFEKDREYDFDNIYNDPLNDVIPVSIDASEKNFMIFNNRQYVSVLFARSYGSSIDEEKTIYSLSDTKYPSFVTIDYAPVSKRLLNDKLYSALANNERNIVDEQNKKMKNKQIPTVSFQKENKRSEIQDYIQQVDSNDESCLLVGLLVVVTAKTEEELADRVQEMIQKGRDNDVYLSTYDNVQLKAFNTALPCGIRVVKNKRAFLTSSLVALMPFHSQELLESGGSFYGINEKTKNFIFANRKNLTSPHGIFVGHTGYGKSFLIKYTEIAQTLVSTDDDIFVIDPQNEFHSICDTYGGAFIDFTPKSDVFINPMEVPKAILTQNESEKERFRSSVKEWLFAFCSSIMQGMEVTEEYKSFLGECADSIYKKIFKKGVIKNQPTLCDIRVELKKLEEKKDNREDKIIIHKMYNALREYTEGSYDMLARPSTIDINNRFVAFGLKHTSEALWEPLMLSIMFFLSNRMEYNQSLRRATRLIIDETQVVTEHEESASMLLKAVVTFRKFGGIVTMAMQNFSRALDNPQLRDMYSNCGFKLFLDQGGMDAQEIVKIQDLSDRELDYLTQEKPGKALMVWGKKVLMLDAFMQKKNPLYKQFSTNYYD